MLWGTNFAAVKYLETCAFILLAIILQAKQRWLALVLPLW